LADEFDIQLLGATDLGSAFKFIRRVYTEFGYADNFLTQTQIEQQFGWDGTTDMMRWGIADNSISRSNWSLYIRRFVMLNDSEAS